MTDPRLYLSGNGENPLSKVANHTLLILTQRVVVPLALAALGWVSAQGYQEIREINARLSRIEIRQAVQLEQINQHDRRINDHDRRLGRLEWDGRRGDGG